MPGRRWDAVPLTRRSAVALLGLAGIAVLAQGPAVAAQAYEDALGDAATLDVERVTVTFGNGTIGLQVRFDPGEVPADRAVRGVVVLGAPGEAEPSEWYQVTIANETTVYVAHGGTPHLASLVATSWTGDIASAEWRREGSSTGPCSFAVVEAGTMDANGFVRDDVGPSGFASPEDAWPVEACPGELIVEGKVPDDEKGSPGLSLVAAAASLALAGGVAWRRRHRGEG
jgi:MYXO-CTERM domain-containing protein